MAPAFLDLPDRPAKPRSTGLTHVLDKGLPLRSTRSLLATAGAHIDIWKFGWGTAYLDPDLMRKITDLVCHQVIPCLGGTLLEVSWLQGRVEACLDWAASQGIAMVEVSRGVAPMSLSEKAKLIDLATDRFTVVSEVGSKDPATVATPEQWCDEIAGDLAAGAWKVVAEGRESGTVGLYQPSGAVRTELVAAVVAAVGEEAMLFEAPRKDQQAWFINAYGANVNLANIALDDVVGVEALRLGLRADTVRP
jgi:phosphosulfolactate synthase